MSRVPFPFENLPQLSQSKIFSHFTPIDIFDYSLCSSKAKKCATMATPKLGKFSIVFGYESCKIIVQFQMRSDEFQFISLDKRGIREPRFMSRATINGHEVYLQKIGKYLEIYWDDRFVGHKMLADYLSTIFKRKYDELSVETVDGALVNLWLSDGVPPTLKKLDVRFLSDDIVKRMLNSYKVTDVLAISRIDRQWNCDYYPKSLRIDMVETSDLNLVYKMSSPQITVESCLFTEQHLNVFLKLWKNNDLPNLQHFRLNQEEFGAEGEYSLSAIFDGFKYVEHSQMTRRRIVVDSRKPRTIERRGGYEIERADGTHASIFFEDFNFLFWAHARHGLPGRS
ncbi:unnamed protein product [Caenorhabditis sp. 36 PRJEB53466]|nr:unnamed protein product [Caenorhabditis sp. 36 PRJEB53466]